MNYINDGFGYDLDRAFKKGNFFEKVFHRSRLSFWLKVCDYSNKKVLDVGCNTGIFLIPLLDKGIDVVGVDVSKEDIIKAKQKLKRLGYLTDKALVADAKKLPFKDNLFGIVLLSDVLEHISNPKQAADEALRVTKRSGLILVTVPNDWHPVVKFSWVRKLLSGRDTVNEFPDVPFNFRKLIKLFPKTEVVKKSLIGFGSEIFCTFKKI